MFNTFIENSKLSKKEVKNMIRHEIHHPHPPHRHEGDGLMKRVGKSLIITSCIAGGMILAGIPLNTVIPSSAPIWMGFATLISR